MIAESGDRIEIWAQPTVRTNQLNQSLLAKKGGNLSDSQVTTPDLNEPS